MIAFGLYTFPITILVAWEIFVSAHNTIDEIFFQNLHDIC